MIPAEARELFFYYGGAILVLLLLFMLAGRRRDGMRLRLRGSQRSQNISGDDKDNIVHLHGMKDGNGADNFSHVQPRGERPLNVVFNFNGHSWDAYEVLGLPAGSSMEKVEGAYREALQSVDPSSRSFMEAAYQAIHSEWKSYRKAGSR